VVEVTVEWLKEMRYTTQHKFSHMTKQASQVSPGGGAFVVFVLKRHLSDRAYWQEVVDVLHFLLGDPEEPDKDMLAAMRPHTMGE
jgi:hypothetical protein